MKLALSRTAGAARVVLSVALGLLVAIPIVEAGGVAPMRVYGALFSGAFGSANSIAGTLIHAAPIGLTTLAVILAFRMKVWNIGMDGQLVMGALAGVVTALLVPPAVPRPLGVALVLLASVAGGALWALGPALLRAYLGVNEVMTTLMLNYVALLILQYLLYGPMKDPSVGGWPYSRPVPPNTWLPSVGTGLNLEILLWWVAAAGVAVILSRSAWGYQIRLIGSSAGAARYAGIDLRRNVILLMLVSGAFAGLAASGSVFAAPHRLFILDSEYYGYTGILVAALVAFDPIASIVGALFYGGLLQSSLNLKLLGLPPSIVTVLEAAIVLVLLAALALSRLRWRRA